jgi:hypothetical protein
VTDTAVKTPHVVGASGMNRRESVATETEVADLPYESLRQPKINDKE